MTRARPPAGPVPRYSGEPVDPAAFRARFDRFYGRTAPVYDALVRAVPLWRRWIGSALPYLRGPRVLEVGFGTGWLLTRYAGRVEAHGIDLNARMVALAAKNLGRAGLRADLRRAAVEAIPFPDAHFDTVVCTAAFSGFPDGGAALDEMIRATRRGGRIVIVDVGYPRDGNRPGTAAIRLWMIAGDLVRDIDALLAERGLEVAHRDVGAWGSMHLWVASSPAEGGPVGCTPSTGSCWKWRWR
jgi:ubiquinone/menaquinone biosynthesis C-methylase UbiE